MLKEKLAYPYGFLVKHLSGRGLTRIPAIRFLNQRIINYFKRDSRKKINFRGHVLFLDTKDSLNLSFSDYEIFETELIEKELKTGDVFLDIGANIGYHTLTAAKRVGPKGRVYAIEPEPENFSILEQNISINGYSDRCVLVRKGVSDKSGTQKLYLDPFNCGGHAFFNHFEKPEVFLGSRSVTLNENLDNFIDVETISIDDFLSNNRRVNVVKMDIEGAELLALRGMLETLKANKRIVIFSEFSPSAMNMVGGDYREFLEILKRLGFEVYDLNENKKTLKKVSIEDVLKNYTVKNAKTTNLLLKK